jgi:hypothetical protein
MPAFAQPIAFSYQRPTLAPSTRPRAETRGLAEGDAGTEETVREMVRLIEEGARDPDINALAVGIVRGTRVRQFDFDGERRALYSWMRRAIRFFRDIDGKETLRAARRTVEQGAGDCDCQTILICALLKTIGHRTRIVTISSHPQAPDIFSHVFAEARDERGRWKPVDAARKQASYGRGPNHWYRRRHWDTEDGSFEELAPGADPMLSFYIPNTYPLPTTGRGRFLLQPGAHGRPSANGGLGSLGHLGDAFSRRLQKRATQAARLGRLGQDTLDELVSDIPQITQGTAQIIAASRANPLNITASSLPITAGQANTLTPAAQALLDSEDPLASIPGYVWLLGIAGVGLVLWKGRQS